MIPSNQQSNFVFDINNYDIKKIDSHEYVVITAVDKKTNQNVEIRLISEHEQKGTFSYQILQGNIYNDAFISQYLNLPGIVKLIGYRLPLTKEEEITCQCLTLKHDYDNIDLTGFISVFEHMKYCDTRKLVYEYLKSEGKKGQLNPTIISKIIFGIAATMKQIHNRNIAHEELTLKNIFLDDNFEPRISYFCSAHFVASNKSLRINSFLSYPQVNLPKSYHDIEYFTFQNDFYHFAALVLSLFDIRSDSVFGCIAFLEDGDDFDSKIKKPENVPDAYWELIKQCTGFVCQQPTFTEITEILRDDKFAFELFGKKTNLEELHEYQNRVDTNDSNDLPKDASKFFVDKQQFS